MEELFPQLVGFLGVINMAKKIRRFTDEDDKELNNPRALPPGVTEDDLRDVEINPIRTRPGQEELAKESDERNRRTRRATREGTASIPFAETPSAGYAAQLKSVVDRFKAAPAGAEKEKHRAMAWSMAEGIKRDSGGDETERRTAIKFVPGQEMPCVNGRCHNTVPWDGPKHEPEGSPITAGITTCSGGKCDIPGAVASRPAER